MPDDWAGGDRRKGGVSRTQAFAWNCRNQALDAKGEAQAAQTARRDYREPDDTIAQRLAIHPPDFRCVFARRAIKDRSDGQQPACLPGMLSPPGELANVLGRVIRPNCKSISHGNPPFATLNHLPGDL